ncbi:MAG: GTP cyclohydrolase II [Rhizomicrobium sp.]
MQTSSSARPKRPPPARQSVDNPNTNASLVRVAHAVDALKMGQPVRLAGRSPGIGEWTLLAVESLSESRPSHIKGAKLVLPHARARTLHIPLYTPEVVALSADKLDPATLNALSDPTHDLDNPLKGPFSPLRQKLPPAFAAAVQLTKLAGLLPAALLFKSKTRAVKLSPAEIFAYEAEAAAGLKLAVRAEVPLEGAETAEMVAFRAGDGGPDHFAIIVGHPSSTAPVLTRLHSECFTGDLLGSLKCDCGQQLRGAIARLHQEGSGVLLYLAQEGRGIGLLNKLRAYHLQDQGFDTVEANERLGFKVDERQYLVAARMLALLGFHQIRLLTNNPAKVEGLTKAGVKVAERVPHAFASNPHNIDYLRVKAQKTGHLLPKL